MSEQSADSHDNSGARKQTLMFAGILAGVFLLIIILLMVGRSRAGAVAERRAGEAERTNEEIDVVVREIETRTFVDSLKLPATVEAISDVWLSAQVGGLIVELPVAEGEEVGVGQIVARIDDRDFAVALEAAEGGLDAARAQLELARVNFERMTRLSGEGTVGGAELDNARSSFEQAQGLFRQARSQLERSRLELERTRIRSPIAGVLTRLPLEEGEMIGAGNRAARVVDISLVKVIVGIPEREVNVVRGIEEADIRLKAVPGRVFRGRVRKLAVEPAERVPVYDLELAVDNPDGRILPGMLATVDVVREVRENAIVVPFFAVVVQGRDRYCYVVEDGVARRRNVLLGAFLDSMVEVREGLVAGDALIIVGQTQVSDGAPVKSTETVPADLQDLIP